MIVKNYVLEKPFDYKKHSSIGSGGYAPVAYYPKTVNELTELVNALETQRIPFTVLGNLTNVLPSDGESQTQIISTKLLTDIEQTENGIYALAGVKSGALLKACKLWGLSGVEFLEGIPCTLGGALYMNAGVSGNYIASVVESVSILRAGKLIVLEKNDCEYAYKSSVFMRKNDVIVGARLKLQKTSAETVCENVLRYREKRAHLPKGKSMGCVFKNPENAIAGKLIEGAGLKGLRVGGAVVSSAHANFIINDGNATSEQIKTLIQLMKNAVFAQYKIRLEEEIRYLR